MMMSYIYIYIYIASVSHLTNNINNYLNEVESDFIVEFGMPTATVV